MGHLTPLEHEIVHINCRHRGGNSGPAARQRDDQIESLDGELQKHHQHRDEDRADRRQDNTPINSRHVSAVDLRRLDQIRIHRTQTGQEQGHDKAGRLPDAGDYHRVDRHLALDQPVELETRPAQLTNHALDSGRRAEQPAPDRARHHERDRQRIEIDGAPKSFGANALINQDRQRQPDGHGADHVKRAEQEEIVIGDAPAPAAPQFRVMMETDQGIIGHQGRVRERDPDRPAAKDEHVDKGSHQRGRQNELRQHRRQPLPERVAPGRCGSNRRETDRLGYHRLRASLAWRSALLLRLDSVGHLLGRIRCR